MRKIFGMALCFTLVGISFVNAAGRDQRSSSGGGTAEKPKVIQVWTNNAHSKPEYVAAVERYNKGEGAQRGISIDYTVYGSDYYTVLDIAISAGEEPYIYKVTGKLPQYVQAENIIPLTDLPGWFQTKVVDRYKPYNIKGTTIFDGVPYTIPWAISGYCSIAYNVPLLKRAGFDAPPKTWEEFEKACIAISKLDPGKLFGTYVPLRYPNYDTIYVTGAMAPSYGKFWFDFSTGRYCFSDMAEYFEMFQRIRDAGAMFPGIESLDDDTARAQFAEGNIGFEMINPSFNIGVFYDQFPAKMEWATAPIPVKDPGKNYNVMGGTATTLVVSRKAKDQKLLEEVARVYDFWISDEVQMELFTNGKDLPIIPEIVQKAKPSDRPQWNDLAALAAGTVLRPNFPDGFFAVEGDSVNTAFAKIFTGANAAQILSDMDRRFNAAMDQAVSRGVIKREDFIMPEIEERFQKK
ncbi:MAG: extracellular solute-binding protein [Treponema sp.]|jgi:multiple sugar transport system substrate-binding protein|nr:extracellular solute-binding protein [Treponema sp.]